MALETDKHFETALQTDCLPRQIASFEGLTSINVPQSRFSMAFGLSCIIFAKDRQQRTTHPERQTTAPATTKLSLREGFLTSVVITFRERLRLTLTHPIICNHRPLRSVHPAGNMLHQAFEQSFEKITILHITCNIKPQTYMMHIDTRRRQNRIKKARAANRRMSVNLYVAFLCRQHASYQQI